MILDRDVLISRKLSSLSNEDLPNVDIFHSTKSKNHIRQSVHRYQQKIFTCWEAVKLGVADTNFPKF